MARGCNTRREMYVVSDVSLIRHEGSTCVQADAQVDRSGRESVRDRLCRSDRSRCRAEGEEEGVSLRVHLNAALRRAEIANDPPVLG